MRTEATVVPIMDSRKFLRSLDWNSFVALDEGRVLWRIIGFVWKADPNGMRAAIVMRRYAMVMVDFVMMSMLNAWLNQGCESFVVNQG
jgi:hypothetical protein